MTPLPALRPLVLVAALLAAASAGAAPASASTSTSALPTQIREVEGVHEYRLPDGLQVLLIPDASKPTVTVNVTYRVGSRMEGYGETGMAHLLEHLMFRSTQHIPNVGVALSRRGMQFNGSTTADRTNYFETFPSDPAQLDWALQTEAERMTHANVIRKDLDSEMTVVRNEMESGENDPFRILLQKTNAAAYQWHAYGKDTIGARSDVEHVNIAHLQAFYRKYYQADNATLIVAGKFDPARTLASIQQAFAHTPRPTRQLEHSWTVEPVQDGEREVTLRRVGGEQVLLAEYHIPAEADPAYPAFEVISTALADTPNGRLHKRLVEAGHATEVFGWASRRADPGQLYVGAVLKKEDDLAAARKILLSTVEGLAAEPITAAELKRAQLQFDKDFEQTMADPQRLCLSLSEAIAGGDWRLLFLLRQRLDALTLDQVNAAARDWIKSSNRTLGEFIPTEHPDRTPLARHVDAAEALKDFHPTATVSAGEAFDPSPANIDHRTLRVTLPGGMKLALLPKKSRGQTVEVRLALHFGSLDTLRGQATASAAVPALLATGTLKHDRARLADAFDALKTDWDVGGSGSHAEASLTTRRDQLLPALALLAEVLRQPAFPASEFEQYKRQALQSVEHARQEPTAVASLALGRALHTYAPDDIRHRMDFDEQARALQALRLDDVKAFYQRFWGADHAELAVVGDFDAAQVQAAAQRLFGDWHSGAPYARVPEPASDVTGQRLVNVLPDKANAIAIGELPLKLQDTDPDYPALMLAAQVLGGDGFDSRLLVRLRQKDGLSYSVGDRLSASAFEPAGGLMLYAIYAPQNRAHVESDFAAELARFVQDGVTDAELADARKAILDARLTARTDDGAVAAGWADRLHKDRTFAFTAAQEAQLKALGTAQVNAAIRRWIDPSRIDWSLAGSFGAH